MSIARILAGLALLLCCVPLSGEAKTQSITVTGKLTRVMAIGGESTGWSIELDAESAIDDKQVHAVEVAYHNAAKLEKLDNKRVKATGKLSRRQGVERGERTVLEISSIKAIPAIFAPVSAALPFNLVGSEWQLEDLGGNGVIDNVQATLTFADAARVTGNASCNHFFGPAKIGSSAIQLGPLGSSRMACPEAVMNQETKFLNALQAAERFEWKDPYLLIYCKGFEKPLRFTRLPTSGPAKHGGS
jgi:heat shock protein HslJ